MGLTDISLSSSPFHSILVLVSGAQRHYLQKLNRQVSFLIMISFPQRRVDIFHYDGSHPLLFNYLYFAILRKKDFSFIPYKVVTEQMLHSKDGVIYLF